MQFISWNDLSKHPGDALRYHPITPLLLHPLLKHPPVPQNLGGCHTKTGGVLTPPRGGVYNSLSGT